MINPLLRLERNSLEYLLHHFCDVEANKEYQTADWRLRPLPDEMIKYAREDTHHLLHIYDLMRCRLLSLSFDENAILLEVYKRSSKVCMQLYEKELFLMGCLKLILIQSNSPLLLDYVNGGIRLLMKRMKVPNIYCQTKLCLRLRDKCLIHLEPCVDWLNQSTNMLSSLG